MRHAAFILILFSLLFLTACGGVLEIAVDQPSTSGSSAEATLAALQTQVATLQPGEVILDLDTDPEVIRRHILNSHQRWLTLWADGVITQRMGDSTPAATRVQLWVDQANYRFRMVSGPLEQSPDTYQVTDGETLLTYNLTSGEQHINLLPGSSREPFNPPQDLANVVEPHPLSQILMTAAANALMPSPLAQRGGDYRPVELTTIAGRPALVVEWFNGPQMADRFWVDTQTGILLRWQNFGKGTGSTTTADLEVELTSVEINPAFAAELFTPTVSAPPAFALNASGTPVPTPEPPQPVFTPGEGELYFVINAESSGEGLRLVRLPGSCVTGAADCPAPQDVAGFPNRGQTIEPLFWSPDGSRAALPLGSELWSYTAETGEWQRLAQFPILYPEVVWSPDSTRLAFSAHSSDTVEDLFTLHADGSELQNITNGKFAGEGNRLGVVAWLDSQTVAFMHVNRRDAVLYSTEISGGAAKRLNNLTLPNGVAAFSPDRQFLTFATQTESEGAILWQADNSGAEPKRIASFQSAVIVDIAYTPDGGWITFLVLNSSAGPGESVSVIYAIRPDGTDLRQLHQSSHLNNLQPAPDGLHLVVEEVNTGRLAVINIEGGPPRMIEVPGLALAQPWRAPAWRNNSE